jgi:hypothetical protein
MITKDKTQVKVANEYRINRIHNLAVCSSVCTLLYFCVIELQELIQPRKQFVLADKKGCNHITIR